MHKDLIQKKYFDSELKKVDDKANRNSSKLLSYDYEIQQRDSKINNLERHVSYFKGKDCIKRSYLLFLTNYKYIERVIDSTNNITYAHSWQSDGISDEKLNASGKSTSNDEAPIVIYVYFFLYLKNRSINPHNF